MSVAIGSCSISGASSGYMSGAALHAELARYQKQLSDSVNCPSSKTLEGKANIQELSNKISVDQAHIKNIEVTEATDRAQALKSTVTAVNTEVYTSAGVTSSTAGPADSSRINVYA